MGKGNIIAHQDGSEGTKGHPARHQGQHVTHICKELHTLVAKEYAEGYTKYIEPLRMMGIPPVLHALYEVHMASFLGKKKRTSTKYTDIFPYHKCFF